MCKKLTLTELFFFISGSCRSPGTEIENKLRQKVTQETKKIGVTAPPASFLASRNKQTATKKIQKNTFACCVLLQKCRIEEQAGSERTAIAGQRQVLRQKHPKLVSFWRMTRGIEQRSEISQSFNQKVMEVKKNKEVKCVKHGC